MGALIRPRKIFVVWNGAVEGSWCRDVWGQDVWRKNMFDSSFTENITSFFTLDARFVIDTNCNRLWQAIYLSLCYRMRLFSDFTSATFSTVLCRTRIQKRELFLHSLHLKWLISVFILHCCFYFHLSLAVATISFDILASSNLLWLWNNPFSLLVYVDLNLNKQFSLFHFCTKKFLIDFHVLHCCFSHSWVFLLLHYY